MVYNQDMSKPKIIHKDYSVCSCNYQFRLPLELEVLIPNDDPVRLLNVFVEDMELTDLYQTYGKIKKSQASPRQMFKIVIYAAMNRIYSSRDIESACRRDINFMYLLEGKPAPDHATIARFISLHLSQCSKKTLAAANRYTFVWKKAVTKHQKRLCQKIAVLVEELELLYGIRFIFNGKRFGLRTLKKIRKKLYALKEEEGIEFVHGCGKRKSQLQRSIETLEEYIDKLKEYNQKIHKCGDRNSYSKTDPDATFMHMKDDHMRNSQLKPGYNVQFTVNSQFIVGLGVFPNRTDYATLPPMLETLRERLGFRFRQIVADSGYESLENYRYLDRHKQEAYIKPNNYESRRTKKFKSQIGRAENMAYYAPGDYYLCKNGRILDRVGTATEHGKDGTTREVARYRCEDCSNCSYRAACCKARDPERRKELVICREFAEYREASLSRISTEEGKLLRVNRSIQAEGAFGQMKHNRKFVRFLTAGNIKVTCELFLLALSQNIRKAIVKCDTGRLENHILWPHPC